MHTISVAASTVQHSNLWLADIMASYVFFQMLICPDAGKRLKNSQYSLLLFQIAQGQKLEIISFVVLSNHLVKVLCLLMSAYHCLSSWFQTSVSLAANPSRTTF